MPDAGADANPARLSPAAPLGLAAHAPAVTQGLDNLVKTDKLEVPPHPRASDYDQWVVNLSVKWGRRS